jgi:hypothetical protein
MHSTGSMARLLLRIVFGLSALAALVGAVLVVHPAWAAPTAALIARYDRDGDRELGLPEVRSAAGSRFDRLTSQEHGSVLDRRQTRSLIGATQFRSADSDADGTISRDEYRAYVDRLFRSADLDHDGTLSSRELKSRPGVALRNLIN